MGDTPYKTKILPLRLRGPSAAGVRGASWPAPLMRASWREALRAHDFVPPAYRVICVQHTGGSAEWCSGNFTVGGGAQEYPDSSTWRTVHRTRVELTPGCALQVRVVALRSGPTERFSPPLWVADLLGGQARVLVGYTNTSADSASATVQLELPASNETDSWEPTTAGGSWGALVFRAANLVIPPGVNEYPADAARWSEATTVTLEIQHRGGARVVCVVVSEVPHRHVVAHDVEQVSIHGWPDADQPPDQRPQIESRDGLTYEEHRYGPHRSLEAAARQRAALGPVIASWGSYAEALAEVDDADTDPVQVTSTTFVGLSIGSAITSWATSNPGYSVAGHYARPMPENSPLRARTSASIPVRARVYARFTGAGSNTGYVKFQSTDRSSFLVTIPQSATWAWHTITAWIECSLGPDDTYPVLQDFARVTGGTMEIRAWSVVYGAVEVA